MHARTTVKNRGKFIVRALLQGSPVDLSVATGKYYELEYQKLESIKTSAKKHSFTFRILARNMDNCRHFHVIDESSSALKIELFAPGVGTFPGKLRKRA